MAKPSPTPIRLYLPSKKNIDDLTKTYSNNYSKNELADFVGPIRKALLHKEIEIIDESSGLSVQDTDLNLVLESLDQTKARLIYFLALMLGDLRNIKVFVQNMSEKHLSVYRLLLRTEMLKLSEVRSMLGVKKDSRRSGSYGWSSLEKLDLPFLTYYDGGYDRKFNRIFYVGIDPKHVEMLYDILMPEERQLMTIDELPAELEEGCFEVSTISRLPVLEALMEQSVLLKGANKFNANSVKSGIRQLGAEEFFSGLGLPKPMPTLRGSIMLQTIGLVWDSMKNEKKSKRLNLPEQMVRYMYENLSRKTYLLYPILMSHFSGLRPSLYSEFYGDELHSILNDAVKELDVGVWTNVSSILRRHFVCSRNAKKLKFMSSYTFNRSDIYNKFNDNEHGVSFDQLKKELSIPFIKGLLIYMAAWGIFDIGCREYDSDDVSPFDTLEYVRLTPLGAYVLKLSDKYACPKTLGDEVYFELDAQRLIIRSLKDNNPYETLLSDTCTAIGNKRYKMTAETFLSRCSDQEDVKGKIEFFKKYISGDLTPVWTDFFDSLLQRCNPLTSVDASNYDIYKISPDNTTLIRLLANDEQLRQLVIKAEHYLLLVAKPNKLKFELRLKSLGYLI